MANNTTIADEFGAFTDEVMNAEWLPLPGNEGVPACHTPAQDGVPANRETDIEAYLRHIYRAQC